LQLQPLMKGSSLACACAAGLHRLFTAFRGPQNYESLKFMLI